MESLSGNLTGTVQCRVYHRPKISGRMHIVQNISNLDSTRFQCSMSGYMHWTTTWMFFILSVAHTTCTNHNIWHLALRRVAAVLESSSCEFSLVGSAHLLFLGRNSFAECSSQNYHLWWWKGTSLPHTHSCNSYKTQGNQVWHGEMLSLCLQIIHTFYRGGLAEGRHQS